MKMFELAAMYLMDVRLNPSFLNHVKSQTETSADPKKVLRGFPKVLKLVIYDTSKVQRGFLRRIGKKVNRWHGCLNIPHSLMTCVPFPATPLCLTLIDRT